VPLGTFFFPFLPRSLSLYPGSAPAIRTFVPLQLFQFPEGERFIPCAGLILCDFLGPFYSPSLPVRVLSLSDEFPPKGGDPVPILKLLNSTSS